MEVTQSLVSVILPVFNQQPMYLETSIRSILHQTYPHFELIVIDDGSDLDTQNLLRKISAGDPRVQILRKEINSGIADALNDGIEKATGEFIARMDSDDISEPDRLERQVKFLQENKQVDILGGPMRIFGENKQERVAAPSTSPANIHLSMFFGCSIYHPTIMARREVYLTHPYPKGYLHAEDYGCWLQIVTSEKSDFKISNLGTPHVLHYRRHAMTLSRRFKTLQIQYAKAALGDALLRINKDIPNLSRVVEAMYQGSETIDSCELIDQVIATIESVENFLLKRNFSDSEQKNLREEATKRIGEIAILGMKFFPNVSNSSGWRKWISRSPAQQFFQLMTMVQKSPPPVVTKPILKNSEKLTKKVTVVCFSKDRTFQLREYLRTLFLFVGNVGNDVQIDVVLLYKATGTFVKSFQKLISMFPSVKWIEETDFATQLQEIINEAHDFILWGVDDVLYYDNVNILESIQILNENENILTASLRMHPNITYCHPANAKTTVPKGEPIYSKGNTSSQSENEVLKFDRFEGTHDWNYPFELCATLMRKEDVLSIMAMIVQLYGQEGISHPNKFEVCGARLFSQKRHPKHSLKYCTCLSKPVLSVITVNRVQDVCTNPIFEEVDLETLDKYFWENLEFDLDYYKRNCEKFNAVHIGDFVLKGK